MTTGAGLETAAAGISFHQGTLSCSVKVPCAVPNEALANSTYANSQDAKRAPNSASSWKAVWGSAGISMKSFENEKKVQGGSSSSDKGVKSSSMARGSTKTAGSLLPQSLAASRASSETKRSVGSASAIVPDLAPMVVSDFPESDATVQDRKTPRKSDSGSDAQWGRAFPIKEHEKPVAAGSPEPATILEATAAVLPAIVIAPVSAPPARTELDDSFVSSMSALVKRDANPAASLQVAVSEAGIRWSENATGVRTTGVAIKNEVSSTLPFRSDHPGFGPLNPSSPDRLNPARPTDPGAELAAPTDLASSTSLQSTRSLAATQLSFSSVSAAEKFRQGAEARDGKVPGAKVAAGKQVPLDPATALPERMASHQVSADGTTARPSTPPGARNSTQPARTIETPRAASRPGLTVEETPDFVQGRESAGVQTSSVTERITATASKTASTSEFGIHETFVSLDGARTAPTPTWVHAGPRMAEAGYQDPVLGWVAVRAQTDINGVHASLVPNSADAAQALGGHLASLNAYLTEHHSPVETLTMAAPESRSHEQSLKQGSGQDGGQHGEQGAGQGSSMSGNTGQPADSQRDRVPVATAVRPIVAARSEERVVGTPAGGVYISVMA
jgi:hypothetical protein